MNNKLVQKTIEMLKNNFIGDLSFFDAIIKSYNEKYETWSGESVNYILNFLDKAARTIPKNILISESNDLAEFHGCDKIEEWNYDCQGLELEMFIDEVFEEIENEIKNP